MENFSDDNVLHYLIKEKKQTIQYIISKLSQYYHFREVKAEFEKITTKPVGKTNYVR